MWSSAASSVPNVMSSKMTGIDNRIKKQKEAASFGPKRFPTVSLKDNKFLKMSRKMYWMTRIEAGV